jgi:pimeloyl-ACP methyl ester carboxylesterase
VAVSHVELEDGRRLKVADFGSPDGVVTIVHHGTPGGTVPFPPWVEESERLGLRLIMYARPGYSTSTRHAGRRVADAAADTAAIADALGAHQFLSFGFSGGGPHVLACAALLPDRVVAAASLASVAPYGIPGFDFFDGMGAGNIEEFGLVISGGEQASRPATEEQTAGLLAASPAELVEAMAPHLTEMDAAEMRGPLGVTLHDQMKDGLADGCDGWVDDDLLFVQPWGFDLSAIRVPVLLWQGRQDAMVPYNHGAWLASQIPGVEARLSEEDSHCTVLNQRMPSILAWLRERWDARTVV